jgi:hypothetical protein
MASDALGDERTGLIVEARHLPLTIPLVGACAGFMPVQLNGKQRELLHHSGD